MKSLALERGSRWLRKQMSHFGLPKAHHPGALFHMLLAPSWMPSSVLHFWFLNPHAEPVKGAVSFIFSALLNWLSVGVTHLPFKHSYPSVIHLEKGIKKKASKDEMVLLGWWDAQPWVLCSLRAGQGSRPACRPMQYLASQTVVYSAFPRFSFWSHVCWLH